MAVGDIGPGVAAVVGAAALYSSAVALQAHEARRVDRAQGLHLGLFGRLAQRPLWLASIGLMTGAFALQVTALSFVSLAVVQPFQAVGLVLLVLLGVRRLGERVGRRELLAIGAVVCGVTALALTAPSRGGLHPNPVGLAIALPVVGGLALAPLPVRGRLTSASGVVVVAAGLAYAWSDFVSKLVAQAFDRGDVLEAVGWLAGVACFGVLGMLWESSAFQRRAAVQVAPVVLSGQLIVPIVLGATVAGESWGGAVLGGWAPGIATAVVLGGAVVLARSPAAVGFRTGT